MANALDLFRAQHEAAQEIQARLQEIETTLSRVCGDVDRIVHDKEFRAVLQQEHNWLTAARRTVIEVRAWREQERRRYGPGVAMGGGAGACHRIGGSGRRVLWMGHGTVRWRTGGAAASRRICRVRRATPHDDDRGGAPTAR
jgi:hypothetical protein